MRSVILHYPRPPHWTGRLDILTQNLSVKQYFYDIGYEVGFENSWSFPTVNSYNDIWPLHLWLAKLLWNIPSTKMDDTFQDEIRHEFVRWVANDRSNIIRLV